jgi:hypothetical protein
MFQESHRPEEEEEKATYVCSQRNNQQQDGFLKSLWKYCAYQTDWGLPRFYVETQDRFHFYIYKVTKLMYCKVKMT